MGNTTNEPASGRTGNGGTDVQTAREASRQARAAVREEVRKLIAEVENLLQCVKNLADPELARARAEVENGIAATRQALSERADQVRRRGNETLEASNRYVHERPWAVIGVAALSGLLLGLLVARRGPNEPGSM
jgi:ElaB/YqjD/DUF883 family membrane-anchored ribosome-binding protein